MKYFSFRETLRDVEAYKKFLQDRVKKFDEINERLKNRTGPYLQWFDEKVDDTKVVVSDPTKEIYPTLTRLFCDLDKGVSVVAGKPNAGKSTLIISLITSLIQLNKDVIVIDISLDDPSSKRNVQLRANQTGLHYQRVYNPNDLNQREKEHLEEADQRIKDWISSGRLIQLESSEDFEYGSGICSINVNSSNRIFEVMELVREKNPDSKIVMFLDAWNDVTYRDEWSGSSDLNQSEAFLNLLKINSNKYNIVVFTTAHIRKSGNSKENYLSLEDVKGTRTLESNCVYGGIIRNEYRERIVDDPLTFNVNGIDYPVIRLDTLKTKVSSWDMPWFGIMKASHCQILPIPTNSYPMLLNKLYNRDSEEGKKKW
jgi:GTPase SAR1 family protein